MLKRSIPAGLNVTASGLPYWDTDLAGFFFPILARTGAPFVRPLFMEFPADPNIANIPDEYMFGPAFLVASVT